MAKPQPKGPRKNNSRIWLALATAGCVARRATMPALLGSSRLASGGDTFAECRTYSCADPKSQRYGGFLSTEIIHTQVGNQTSIALAC